jgi:hypothetical protein
MLAVHVLLEHSHDHEDGNESENGTRIWVEAELELVVAGGISVHSSFVKVLQK